MNSDPSNFAIAFTAWLAAMHGYIAGVFWWFAVDERLKWFLRVFSEPEGYLGMAIYSMPAAIPAIVCGLFVRRTAVRALTVTLTTAAFGSLCGGAAVVTLAMYH